MKNPAIILLFALFTVICTAQVSCNLTYQRTLSGFDVYIHTPSGATMYRAKMYIDADGSPRAYGPNNSGLDYTANAGYPGNWWALVTDANGNPIIQTASNPYPGMYVSATSLVNASYGLSNPLRYVNSETVPYIAMPTNVLASGNIHVGDVAYVYNTVTGQSCFAIYADAGNSTSIGEGSIYLANKIGVNPNARTGGTSLGIIDYIVFPHSGFGQGYIPTIAQIDSIGNAYLNRPIVGGHCIVSCLGGVVDHKPTTLISSAAPWDTTAFTSSFTDTDIDCSSGIERSFYQVSDLNNNDWRSNPTHGFFNEDFNGTTIKPDWTVATGSWSINSSNFLQQSDVALSNTNIYAPLTQNLSNTYLYHWKGRMSGTGTNRRAGFHFFCDQPTQSERGNSYFVFFRLDNDLVQIYKVVNNSWGSSPVYSTAYNFTASQLYDFKVMYDRVTGLIRVYINDTKAAQWTDPSPISNGSYVSFRSANCKYEVDEFRAYRSRTVTTTVSVGTGNANDLRYQNVNPSTPAGRIRSIVTDITANISSIAVSPHNIDFSDPSVMAVNDGTAADIDLITNGTQLSANWTAATDPHSGIIGYRYAVGTTPGASNVVPWTSTPTTSVTITGLSLASLQYYYFSVQAENGAHMRSASVISDGQLYFPTNFAARNSPNVTETADTVAIPFDLVIYPNPSTGKFTVTANQPIGTNCRISVINTLGEQILDLPYQDQLHVDLSGRPNGMYYLIVKGENLSMYRKILVATN